MVACLVDDEMRKIWKEAVVELQGHFPGILVKNTEDNNEKY
jgi:hypothetical protein